MFPIDTTFEIQIRTMFSEGWHEVEHDLRYKCDDTWVTHNDLSRNLNGLLATVETCDWSMLSLLDELAYRNYLSGDYQSMLRNKYRLRLRSDSIDMKLLEVLAANKGLAKMIYRGNRNELLSFLSRCKAPVPLTSSNIIYCINELSEGDDEVRQCAPNVIREIVRRERHHLIHIT